VDAGFSWMINHSGGGDFLVIRTSGTDAYNKYIYSLGNCSFELQLTDEGHLHSVATLLITSRDGSNSDFVYNKLKNCEALFIAGGKVLFVNPTEHKTRGDQSTYVNLWNNTRVQTTVQYLLSKGVPIGNCSLGSSNSLSFINQTEIKHIVDTVAFFLNLVSISEWIGASTNSTNSIHSSLLEFHALIE
jgi:cyanophycinase